MICPRSWILTDCDISIVYGVYPYGRWIYPWLITGTTGNPGTISPGRTVGVGDAVVGVVCTGTGETGHSSKHPALNTEMMIRIAISPPKDPSRADRTCNGDRLM
jgi:hypothetical protein